jgi:hypothetical protein
MGCTLASAAVVTTFACSTVKQTTLSPRSCRRVATGVAVTGGRVRSSITARDQRGTCIIWHHASVTCILIVSVTGQIYAMGGCPACLPPPIMSICLKAKLHKATSLPLLPAKLLNIKSFYRLCFCRVTLQRQRRSPSRRLAWRNVRTFCDHSVACFETALRSKGSIRRATKWLATRGTGPTVGSGP